MGTEACARCNGLEWVEDAEGRLVRCLCSREKDLSAALERALGGIAARHRHCARSNWQGRWPLDEAAAKWLAVPGADPWALVIIGPPGVGKTHVATAVYRELLVADPFREARWITAEEASDAARREIGREPGARAGELDLATVGLLLLDDVGRERATPFALEFVRRILHYRHLHMLPTILTANATQLADFDVFDPALTSRLREGTLIYALRGQDYRLKRRSGAEETPQ